MAFSLGSDMLIGESSTLDQVFLPTLGREGGTGWEGGAVAERGQKGSDHGGSRPGHPTPPPPDSYTQIMVSSEPSARCHQASVVSALVVVLVLVLVVVGWQHVRLVLLWLETADPVVAGAVFTLLFTLVSLPPAWGCMLLMVTAGYLYSFLYGPLMVMGSGGMGLLLSHMLLRKCCRQQFMRHFHNDRVRAVLNLLESDQAFKIIALARLTPIPFGLQNGLFALAEVPVLVYVTASLTGLMPMVLLNCYLGSTLRTMEDVLSDENSRITGLLIFGGQILVTAGLLLFAVRKARVELKRTVETLSEGVGEGVGEKKGDLVEVISNQGC